VVLEVGNGVSGGTGTAGTANTGGGGGGGGEYLQKVVLEVQE
jgi:hypothetical protein